MAFWNDPTTLLPKQAHRWIISFDKRNLTGNNQDVNTNLLSQYFAKSVDRPSYEVGVQEAKYLYSHTFKFPKRVTWKPITIVFYDSLIRESEIKLYKQSFYNTDLTGLPNGTYERGGPIQFNNRESSKASQINVTDTTAKVNIEDNPTQSGGQLNPSNKMVNRSTQMFFYKFLQDIGYHDPEELAADDSLLRFRTYNFKQDMVKSFVGNKNEAFDRGDNGQNIDTKSWSKLQIKELDENGNEKEIWNVYNPLVTNVSFDKLDYGSEDTLKITVTVNYDWAELDSNEGTFKAEVVNEYSSLGQPKKVTVKPAPQIPTETQRKIKEAQAVIDRQLQKPAVKEALLRQEAGAPLLPSSSDFQSLEARELLNIATPRTSRVISSGPTPYQAPETSDYDRTTNPLAKPKAEPPPEI